MISDAVPVDSERSHWSDPSTAVRFAEREQRASMHVLAAWRTTLERAIVQRHAVGNRILDVGVGLGRMSIPFVEAGAHVTGVDLSAAMIERCRAALPDRRLRLVHADLADLPFADGAFDTVLSVDAFNRYPAWTGHFAELVRVTRAGGRVIVNVGSSEHRAAVERLHGAGAADACSRLAPLCTSGAALREAAALHGATLVALVPYGVTLGAFGASAWFDRSAAARTGALERMLSWIGADPQLAAFVEFLERRLVAHLPPAVSGESFAIVERRADAAAWTPPPWTSVAARDPAGAADWHASFAALAAHEPSRSLAAALALAARPLRVAMLAAVELPEALRAALQTAERGADLDAAAAAAAAAWETLGPLHVRGVDVSAVLAAAVRDAARAAGEAAR